MNQVAQIPVLSNYFHLHSTAQNMYPFLPHGFQAKFEIATRIKKLSVFIFILAG